jgi:hypothetical protein
MREIYYTMHTFPTLFYDFLSPFIDLNYSTLKKVPRDFSMLVFNSSNLNIYELMALH